MADPLSLAKRFEALLDEPVSAALAGEQGAGAWVQSRWAEGKRAWPGVESSEEVFAKLVAARLNDGMSHRELDGGEVYIAAACTLDDSQAISCFEEKYFPALRRRISEMRLSEALREEVLQRVREKLFVVAGDELPAICKYAGRGRLVGLVQITGYRTALTLLRRDGGSQGSGEQDELLEIPTAAADPEVASIRRQFASVFRKAFAAAMANRTSRERNLLRLRYIDGLSVDQISALYDVHRTTGSRWFSAVRQDLLRETRDALQKELALEATQLSSLLQLIDSQLEISVERLLRKSSG